MKTNRVKSRFKRRILSIIVKLFTWIGAVMLYYLLFSIYFDTPIEYEIRKTNKVLEQQYASLSSKLDSISIVMDNVSQRDKNVYGMLFEAEPSTNVASSHDMEMKKKEHLVGLSNRELADHFFDRLYGFENMVNRGTSRSKTLEKTMVKLGDEIYDIPSIQPIVNRELTKFAASFGLRVQPFYKSVILHEGVDFALSEDSRIYATADGTVKSAGTGTKGDGLMIEISHGNKYVTTYSHLNKALVSKGNKVKRGDIIAYSGNSGLSFLPHLHYSVAYDGVKVDPINYFYYEITPAQNEKLKELAQLLMQSLD